MSLAACQHINRSPSTNIVTGSRYYQWTDSHNIISLYLSHAILALNWVSFVDIKNNGVQGRKGQERDFIIVLLWWNLGIATTSDYVVKQ